MTHGLYDQIGAPPSADPEALRAAYTRTAARLARRRRDLLDQGGDTISLDLLLSRLEESWQILRDPSRRRRYDALLALDEGGPLPPPDEVWERVAGVLVGPEAAAALELVRAATRLDLPALAPAPGTAADESAGGVPADTQADIPTEALPSPDRVARPMPVHPPPAALAHSGRSGQHIAAVPAVQVEIDDVSDPGAASSPQPPTPSGAVPPSVAAGPAASAVVGIGAGASARADLDAWVAELGWSGALIARVRESRGLTLRDVGDSTRISARYLEAIENDDHEQLPSSTFVKGYLREIARLLDLDESLLVNGYLRRLS